jgi:hypothetical protein
VTLQFKASNKQHNKALHPTAYSFARSSLRFRRRVSWSFNRCARHYRRQNKMATFTFTGKLDSEVVEDYQIDDEELINLNDEEIADVVNKHHAQWIEEVAAASIDGHWERTD